MFAALGVPILDADLIGRELLQLQPELTQRIGETLGPQFIDQDHVLRRGMLRDHVFTDTQARRQLENIMHPAIQTEMQRRLAALHTTYCIVCVPLLLESGQRGMVQRILVVDTPEPLQRQRVKQRDQLPDDQISAIMASQATRSARLVAADDIITNDRDLRHLEQRIKQLHDSYLSLARHKPTSR
jgi:dephospho-CoA kinase